MRDIKWTIGGGLRFYKEITEYLEKTKKFYELDHYIIDSVYDSPHGLIWQGGRVPLNLNISLIEYVQIIKEYNKRGIKFNFTFSNTLLEKKHLKNGLCNYVLKETENEMNGVILSSNLLLKYIKKNYPKFKLISSICRVDKNYNDLLKNHDIVIIQPDDNRKYKMIKKIKDIEKIEILVNEIDCIENCPHRKQHYDDISRQYLKHEKIYKYSLPSAPCFSALSKNKKRNLALNYDEIKKLYNMGVRNFKIQGRDHGSIVLEHTKNFAEKIYIGSLIHDNKDPN
jgi:collagenase-like PrtC family protease